MIDELLEEAAGKMANAVEHTASEFTTIRTGRANPQILHRLVVDYYGQPTPIQQLASFSVPEPRMLVVQPFDKSTVNSIERSIRESDLGLNPSNDGQIIRLVFPTLTEERRRDLIKLVRHMAEEGRIAIRNVRRHVKSDMEALQGEVSEDDIRRAEKELQELTDKYVTEVDKALNRKEEELLEV